ncbi:hypothetical protein D3C71_1233310 [compost metagenome]
MRCVAFHAQQQRFFVERRRPVVAHRRAAIAESHRLGAVLVALRADVLGRITAAYQQDVLVGEFTGITEIMRVQHATGEAFQAFKERRVGRGEMPRCHNHAVELFRHQLVFLQVAHADGEAPGLLRIIHPLHGHVEANLIAHTTLLNAAHDVVAQYRTRRV